MLPSDQENNQDDDDDQDENSPADVHYGRLSFGNPYHHRSPSDIAHNPPGRSHGIDAVMILPATSVAMRRRINEKKKNKVEPATHHLRRDLGGRFVLSVYQTTFLRRL